MKKLLLFLIIPLITALGALGQTTFTWNFGTSTGSAAPSGTLANLVVGNVSIGNVNGTVTMLSTTSASTGYTGASGQFNAGNAARIGALNTGTNGSAYFEFTLTPAAGFSVNLSAISFGTRSTSTAPQAYTLRSSLDSYATNIASGTMVTTGTWELKTNTSISFAGNIGTAVTFRLYGFNGTGSPGANTINWRIDDLTITVSLTSPITAPTTQASNLTFTNIAQNALTANWTNGNGARRVVIMNTSNSFTAPANGTDPTANSVYAGSGEQVVFNGTGNSVNITGLTASTEYWFRVYEYNGTGAATFYNTTTATNNPNSQTTSALAPLINVSLTSLSGFTYIQGAGPSSTQSFTVSGTHLTDNIVLTAPTNYEISLTDAPSFAATSPLTLTQSGGSVANTTVFVRLAASLSANTYNNETVNITSTGATAQTVTLNGTVTPPLAPEPTNHVTGFTATAGVGQITVNWIDASAGQLPAAYLVKAAVSPANATAPVDGTPEVDALLVKNIAQGVQQAVFTGLSSETTYNFSIWPYTNSGSNINFKTDDVIPSASTTTLLPTYTWSGGASGSWTTATNWTPTRTTPANNDILQFNHGAAVTVTAVPTQTIARLLVSNNTPVTLQAGAANNTVTIAGAAGTDLTVEAGSELNLTGGSALSVTLAAAATGSISGSMTLAGAAHRLNSGAASGITFNSGSQFTTGTAFAGNPFGTTSLNSLIFASGSTYNHNAGSNPFGATQPSSVVVFQTGSLYRHLTTGSPSFNGRTYANFELDASHIFTQTGTSSIIMDNLTVTRGTLNFNMTGTPGHAIRGNITVAAGANLNFAPASAGTVYLSGFPSQTISGAGTITAGSFSTIRAQNNIVVDLNTSLHNLEIHSGTFNFNSTGTTGNAITGNVTVATGATLNFAPASAGTVNLSGTTTQNISGAGTITANTNSTIIAQNNIVVDLNTSLHNLEIQSGTFNYNSFDNDITGNITVAFGANLNFAPAIAGTVNLSGITTQTISGAGTITAGSFSTIRSQNNILVDLNTSLHNLEIQSGTFNFNSTGTTGNAITGNITVATGANLNFAPASAGTVNLSGTITQTISGGGTITTGTNSTIRAQNNILVDLNTSLHNLEIQSGTFNFNSTGTSGNAITGNITVAAGANLNFAPASAGTVYLNGFPPQTISGAGTITAGVNSTISIIHIAYLNMYANFHNLENNQLFVNPDGKLSVNGNLVNNGLLQLEGDSTGKIATLLTNTISGTGNFVILSTISGSNNGSVPNGRFWYLSAPISNATSSTFGVAYPYNRLWTYNESTFSYTQVTNDTTALPAGSGFVVRLFETDFFNLFSGISAGSINNGNYSLSLTRTGNTHDKRGYHLLGNPYPSFVNPTATMVNPANHLTPTIWYRTSTGTAMKFETFNYQSQIGTASLTAHIPPMQGFWVQVSGDGNTGTFALDNTMRSHQTGNLLKSNTANNVVRLIMNNSNNTDEALVLFNSSAGAGFDNWDSEKMMNNNAAISELYTVESGKNIVINSMPQLTTNMIVPLFMNIGTSGQHTITADLSEFNLPDNVFLQDLMTSVIHDLSTGPYTFNSNTTTANNRFNLLFTTITSTNDKLPSKITVYSYNQTLYINVPSEGIIEVYDLLGRQVTKKETVSGLNEVQLFAKGVYVVRVVSKEETSTTKVVVK